MAQSQTVRQPPDDGIDDTRSTDRGTLSRRWPFAADTLCLSVLSCLVVASAWLFGGAVPDHQYGFAAAALLAVTTGLFWVVRAPRLPRVHALLVVLGLAVALAAIQLIPFTQPLRVTLSPGTACWQQRLSQDTSTEQDNKVAEDRRPMTLYPESSRQDLARLLIPIAVFSVAAACLGHAGRQRAFCWLLAAHSATLALFGIVQLLTFNGKLFWVVTMAQGGSPFASFVNRNHAAAYFNVCLASLLALWGSQLQAPGMAAGHRADGWRSADDPAPGWLELLATVRGRQLTLWAWSVLLFAAVFLSLSRGAVLSLMVAVVAVLSAIMLRRGSRRIGLVLVLASLLGGGIAVWFGQAERLRQDFAELHEDWRAAGRGRLDHWHDAIRMVPDVWRFGSGLGTYRYLYPLYETEYRRGWFYHAENQYLEALTEAGIGGLSLLLAAVGLAFWTALRALRSDDRWQFGMGLGGLFAFVATTVHAAFDFNLYMPANGILLAMWTGMMCARHVRDPHQSASQMAGDGHSNPIVMCRRRVAWTCVLLACCGGLCWSTVQLYRTASIARLRRGLKAAQFDAAHPTRDLQQDVARLARLANGDGDACRDVASWNVSVFRRATLHDLQTRFTQPPDADYLWEATNLIHLHGRWQASRRLETKNGLAAAAAPLIQRHLAPAATWYQRAREACPLHAQDYLSAAVLSGILGTGEPRELVNHAALVAPQDPQTLFQAGLILLQLKDTDTACQLWNRSLRNSGDYLDEMLEAGNEFLSPSLFVGAVLAGLPLRTVEAAELLARRKVNSELQDLLLAAARDAEGSGGKPSAEREYVLAKVDLLSGYVEQGIAHLKAAVQAEPRRHDWRAELVTALLTVDQLGEALRHARICAHQRPRSGAYRQLVRRVQRRIGGP